MSCWWNRKRSLKLAVGSDERTLLADFVGGHLRKEGHQLELVGPLKGDLLGGLMWVKRLLSRLALEERTGSSFLLDRDRCQHSCEQSPRLRAALCHDAETAEGARLWDDANVLAMSLRSVSQAVAREILTAWFSTEPAKTGIDAELIERAKRLASKYCKS